MSPAAWLLRYMSKIQKESNSQLAFGDGSLAFRCCDICQRYKKKAIHNCLQLIAHQDGLLRYMSKIQKESNGTEYVGAMRIPLNRYFEILIFRLREKSDRLDGLDDHTR